MHYCICAVCEKKFDRDKVQAVKYNGRRYAHIECFPQGEVVPLAVSREDPDLRELKDCIKEIFGDKANYPMCMKQIKNFQNDYGYSYSGITKTLKYFYQIKGNSTEKAKGSISIVPYVYQDAYNYFYNLYTIQQKNQSAEIVEKEKEVAIKIPKSRRQGRMFSFGEE